MEMRRVIDPSLEAELIFWTDVEIDASIIGNPNWEDILIAALDDKFGNALDISHVGDLQFIHGATVNNRCLRVRVAFSVNADPDAEIPVTVRYEEQVLQQVVKTYTVGIEDFVDIISSKRNDHEMHSYIEEFNPTIKEHSWIADSSDYTDNYEWKFGS